MTDWHKKRATRLFLGFACISIFLSGCAMEKRLEPQLSIPPPAWVTTPPAPRGSVRHYVGISIAENALDEQSGRRLAVANAAEQVAENVSMDVNAQVSTQDTTVGPPHRGKEDRQAGINQENKALMGEIVNGLTVRDYYTERWKVRTGFLRSSFTRYKIYALCDYPESEYARLQQSVSRVAKE